MALIWITGAHGFIGRHLARSLAADGHAVHGLGHGMWPPADAERWGVARWVNGEIDTANLRLLQRAGSPDMVFHLAGGSSVAAAVANPREDFFRTVVTTEELLDWLRQEAPAARLVVASSAAVYGAGHDGPIPEHATCTPFSAYGRHKKMMEDLCTAHAASHGVHVAVARLFSVYGTHLRKQLLWDLCARLATGVRELTLGGTGSEMRDWTDVRDVVRALALLASHADAHAPVINIGTGAGTSVAEIVQHVVRAWTQPGAADVAVSFSGHARPGDPFSLVAQRSRLDRLGFEWRIALDDGVGDYVRWFRGQAAVGS